MRKWFGVLVAFVLVLSLFSVVWGKDIPKITIGWTPPDITGVFKTATDFFEKGAEDARNHGINVEIITRAPAAHTAFADQIAIPGGQKSGYSCHCGESP